MPESKTHTAVGRTLSSRAPISETGTKAANVEPEKAVGPRYYRRAHQYEMCAVHESRRHSLRQHAGMKYLPVFSGITPIVQTVACELVHPRRTSTYGHADVTLFRTLRACAAKAQAGDPQLTDEASARQIFARIQEVRSRKESPTAGA